MYTLLNQTEPVARKRHVCDYCGEAILRGHRYVRTAGVGDEGFTDWKTHPECEDAMQSLWDDNILMSDEGCPPFEHARGTTCESGCRCEEHVTGARPYGTGDTAI